MEHIYVAEGAGGLFKIGRTKDPDGRVRSLRQEFKRRGDQIARFEVCGEIKIRACIVESYLIDAIAGREPRARGREWFVRGSFQNAIRAAQELIEYVNQFPPPPSEEQIAKWRVNGDAIRAEREAHKAKRAAWWAAYAIKQTMRRRLRQHGLHAFERIAGELLATDTPATAPATVEG